MSTWKWVEFCQMKARPCPIRFHSEKIKRQWTDGNSCRSNLKSPSGSKGAWHHEGAFGGSGPLSGEFILQSCENGQMRDKDVKCASIQEMNNEWLEVSCEEEPLFVHISVVYTNAGYLKVSDPPSQQHCRQVLYHPELHISPLQTRKVQLI